MPALDGIRGLAVLAVLAFHGGLRGSRGGFLGVDAFFVLSGYLIVSLLVAEWERKGSIALLAFWGRRARRLLPALLLMVGTVATTARMLLPPDEVRLLRGDGLAALFYAANWRMVLRGDDYFADTAAPSPLDHTWSLGIEEQFYLLCPLVLLGVFTLARRPLRALLILAPVAASASTIELSAAYHPTEPGRSYYGTDTRATSLLIGMTLAVLLAVIPAPRLTGLRARIITRTLSVPAAAFLGWALVHASGNDAWLYHGGLLVAALCVAAVLAHLACSPTGVTARVLALSPLRLLGLVSYGVYLWHWPAFLTITSERTGLQGVELLTVRCAATLSIATASYLLVERPLRTSAFLKNPSRTLIGAGLAVGTASLLVVATTIVPTPPGAAADGRVAMGGLQRLMANQGTAPPPAVASIDRPHHPRPRRWRPGTRLVVDVFGDSLPWSLVQGLPRHHGIDVRDRTILGCGITLTAPYSYFGTTYPRVYQVCRGWQRAWTRAIALDDPHLALIMVGRWETMTRFFRGRWRHVGDPVFDAHLRGRLRRAVSLAGAGGARVVLATLPFNRRGEQPDGGLFPEDQPIRVDAWNRLLRSFALKHPEVAVLDLGHRITPAGHYSETAGGFTMRTDGLHLTPEGVRNWIAPWLYPRLIQLARR